MSEQEKREHLAEITRLRERLQKTNVPNKALDKSSAIPIEFQKDKTKDSQSGSWFGSWFGIMFSGTSPTNKDLSSPAILQV